MTTVTKLKNILEVLEKHGEGKEFVCGEHDIIYLSPAAEDAPFAEAAKEAGAHYSSEHGWYVNT